MSDKASGNETEGRRDDDRELELPNTPEGEELTIDREAGDQLDRSDRWWDNSDSYQREGKGNRKVTPNKRAAAEAEKAETAKEAEEVVDNEKETDEDSEKRAKVIEEAVTEQSDELAEESEDSGGESESEKAEEPDEEDSSKELMPWEKDEDEEASSNKSSGEDYSGEDEGKRHKGDKSGGEGEDSSHELEATDEKTEKSSGKKNKDGKTLKVDLKDVVTLKNESEEKDKDIEDGDESPDLGLGGVIANPSSVQRVEAPKKKKAGCWTMFATLFFILTLPIFLAVAVVGFIGWTKLDLLEPEITMVAQAELDKRGIYVDFERWEYQFPRGLVLKEVTLFQSEARQVPQMKLSDLGINVDIVGLIKGRTSFDAGEFSFQDSTLSFFHDGNQVAQIKEIDAEVLVSPGKVDLERFDGRFGGLLVRASGDITNPVRDSTGGQNTAVVSDSEAFVLPLDFAMIEKIRPWLDVQANGKPPRLDVRFSSDGSAKSLILSGSLNGSDFVWHGVPLKRASATFSYDAPANSLEVYSFQIDHGEGTLSGVASLDLVSKVLELENTESDVDLIALLSSFDAGMADKLKSVEVRDAPMIELSGSIPLADVVNSEVEVSYDHLLGIVYTKDSREFPVSRIKSFIKFSGGVITVEDTSCRVLDGDLAVGGTVRLASDNYPFSISTLTLTDLPLSSFAKIFEVDSLGMGGEADLEFRGSGNADLASVRGGGSILVREAKLTAFPVIGKIQDFLGKVIPAFGVRKGDTLSGSYIVESGILLTNDLAITQVGAKVLVNGSVKLKPQTTDFTATASMDPAVVTGTSLEGKQVVITGEGPLREPEIKLKNFPVEFAAEELSSMLGTSPETLDQLKGLIEGEEGVAKMISEQLQEFVGDENATPEIQGLIKGILGNMPSLSASGEGEESTATETSETPEAPVAPEAALETPAPPAAVPFRATPVEE